MKLTPEQIDQLQAGGELDTLIAIYVMDWHGEREETFWPNPVKEHWRRQPTKNGIKLIMIAEHWRGPKDAPIKPRLSKVYKVIK